MIYGDDIIFSLFAEFFVTRTPKTKYNKGNEPSFLKYNKHTLNLTVLSVDLFL